VRRKYLHSIVNKEVLSKRLKICKIIVKMPSFQISLIIAIAKRSFIILTAFAQVIRVS